MIFITAESGYLTPASVPVAARAAVLHWARRDVEPFLPTETNNGFIANVDVNHGRWVVNCPFCNGAQYASSTDLRFFCVDCLNAQANFQYIPTNFPVDANAIEAELKRRPQPEFMNWNQGETAQDLHNEWNVIQSLSNPDNPLGIRANAAMFKSASEATEFQQERDRVTQQLITPRPRPTPPAPAPQQPPTDVATGQPITGKP